MATACPAEPERSVSSAAGLERWLGADRGGDAPRAAQVEAAALMVDVSGFTALTAALEAEHGRRAADRLSMVMDGLLGAFADIIESHRGTVIDIIGDAVQAIWVTDETTPQALCVSRAASAALDMLDHVEAQRDDERMAVRIGIAAGALTIAAVGGHDGAWDLLAWGPALREAALATSLATTGTARVTGRDLSDLADEVDGEADGNAWRLLRPRARPAVKLDPVGRERRRDGDAIWSTDLRPASILFVRLFNAGELVSAGVEPLHRRVLLVQRTVGPHGGVLDKVHADEKGLSAVVAFGIPPSPLTETALRCVAAAVDLRRELRDHAVDVALGVATGKVRSGLGGGNGAARHTIYGGAVNLAARCMQASHDEILSDSATRASAGGAFEFFAPEARVLKGLGAGIEVYGVGDARQRGDSAALADPTPIAGRRAEIALIEAFVDGRMPERLLVLDGEVGIGKSRLAALAVDRARQSGLSLLVCRAGALGSRTPLFAWREQALRLLRNWARQRELRIGEAQAALTVAAGGDASLAALQNPLFGRDHDVAVSDANIDPEDRPKLARRLQAAALAALLGAAANGSKATLIVIEDAHWLDGASVRLAGDLLALLPDLRFLLAGRAPMAAVQETLTEALGDGGFVSHRLGLLDRDGTAALAAGLLGQVDPTHPMVDWLHARTRGNPLFTREMLRALPQDVVAAGLSTPGAWREAEVALRHLDLPQTIEDAAAARLSAQPLARLGLLKAASVVGGAFDRAILRALDIPVAEDALDGELQALCADGILAADGTGDDRQWRFTQQVLRDAVYESMPETARTALHRKAVEHLLRQPSAAIRAASAQIAHHWLEAGFPARALTPMRQAGVDAYRAGAYPAALRFFQEALELATRDGGAGVKVRPLRLAQLNLEVCNAHLVLGEMPKAIPAGFASLAGLWRGPPATTIGWATMLAREAVLLPLHIAVPALHARARRSMRARVDNRLRCEAATRLGDSLYTVEGTLASLAMSLYAARAAECAGDLAIAARPYSYVGYIFGVMRLRRIANFCFNRSLADCLRTDNGFGLHRITAGKLLYAVSMGHWADAAPMLTDISALQEPSTIERRTGMLVTITGMYHQFRGDFGLARVAFEALHRIAIASADDQFIEWSRMSFGRLALYDGNPSAAEAEFNKAKVEIERVHDVQGSLIVECLRAAAILRQERYDEVAQSSDALLTQAEATPLQYAAGDAFGALAEIHNGLLAEFGPGPGGIHRTRAVRAIKRLKQFAAIYPIGRGLAALHAGQLACLEGKQQRAERLWRRGLETARAMEMKYDEARLHAALGEAPSLDDASRAAHRHAAAALAVKCGANGVPPLSLVMGPLVMGPLVMGPLASGPSSSGIRS